MQVESRAKMVEFGLKGDPFILGTQEPDSRPYNPTQLGKDFGAFCKMNGFKCTFHDLRHTFATMMISGGTDVRTVASYLGHASMSMTLNVYADADPEAKKAAVSKVDDAFDVDMMSSLLGEEYVAARQEPALTFSVEQLETMLAQAKASQGGGEVA